MPLFLAKHGLFLVIMLLHMLSVMLYFSGLHMPQKGDYAPAYATFRYLCHILCSGFGVKYALKRRLCYCCTAVWSFPAYLLWFLVVTSYFSFMDRNSTLRTAVVSWCSVVCTAVLLAADCSLLAPPTVFSVLCVGVCASCFFVSFVLADCRC